MITLKRIDRLDRAFPPTLFGFQFAYLLSEFFIVAVFCQTQCASALRSTSSKSSGFLFASASTATRSLIRSFVVFIQVLLQAGSRARVHVLPGYRGPVREVDRRQSHRR